ncbi:AtpZ/AtpI family protein [Alphaproteobacteria bacterium]|nr:AtpZ/AtpI family protein [Alphaproteobacteria bacterium]
MSDEKPANDVGKAPRDKLSDKVDKAFEELDGDLDEFEARLRSVRDQGQESKKPKISTAAQKSQGMAAGGAFLSYIISGGVLGYFLDGFLDTRPWMMLLMLVAGMGLGVHHANKAMQKKD